MSDDEIINVTRELPSGRKAHIRAKTPEEYVRVRDGLERADKTRAADDRARKRDRKFFRKNPHRNFRVRPRLEGELEVEPGLGRWVLVARMVWPGARMRLPAGPEADAVCEELSRLPWQEQEARLYEIFTNTQVERLIAVDPPGNTDKE